jgi:hypothetical protein
MIACIVLFSGVATANTITVYPVPGDMYNLPHPKYYTWGIDASEINGTITEVTLYIEGITNGDDDPNFLFIHLLDNAPKGVVSGDDNDKEMKDAFEGKGYVIDIYEDTNGVGRREDLLYSLDSLGLIPVVNDYAKDGIFAFGLDPDCQFYNEGIEVTITYEPTVATDDESWGCVKGRFKE